MNWGFAHFHTDEQREKASTGLKEIFQDGQILEKILIFNYGPPDVEEWTTILDTLPIHFQLRV